MLVALGNFAGAAVLVREATPRTPAPGVRAGVYWLTSHYQRQAREP